MDSLQETLRNIIGDSSIPIDPQWVEQLYKEHPYFTLPTALLLKQQGKEMESQQRAQLTARTALNAGDRKSLAMLLDDDAAKWVGFYPDEDKNTTPSTNDTIETFLNTYGNPDPNEEEILTKLIFNPTPDYAQLLAEEEERSIPDLSEIDGDSQDAKINAFIIKSRENQGHFPSATEEKNEPEPVKPDDSTVSAPEATDSSMLSESLAKIYIKQGRYSKAYEIISNLSLNFPEKSIYFADQLRFLRKLILIKQKQNN